jgi:hypothetical protein
MLAYGTSRLICRRSLYGALAVRFLHGMKSETTGSTDPEPHA